MNGKSRKCVLVLLACSSLTISSCKKSPAPTTETEPIRISGVSEPPEMLVPPEKKFTHTEQADAFIKAIENIKGGNEATQLPALDAFISRYPQTGDAYPIRATIRCETGDLQGAKSDIEKALATRDHLIIESTEDERPELTATHAKLALLVGDYSTTERDIRSIVGSYSPDYSYLTGGRVKLTDKPESACSWSTNDFKQLNERAGVTVDNKVFEGMYLSAFAPLDDAAKGIAVRYMTDLAHANPSSAPVAFYSAVTAQKVVTYKALAFSDAERADHNREMIELYTKALQLAPNIEAAYADRADVNLQQKDYSSAVSDYDHAIALSPNASALWNDRGLAKEETFDKDGAIADFTTAIELKSRDQDTRFLSNSYDARGDLYVKLGSYRKALQDYDTLIGLRLHDVTMSINLEFFRSLYPEYAKVDDVHLKDKLHRMYYPNFSDQTFDEVINKPEGMHPSLNGFLPEAYLKRADVFLALKDFTAAHLDYVRAERFAKGPTDDRWRVPPGLQGIAVDLQTVDVHDPSNLKVWVRPTDKDNQLTDAAATEFNINCSAKTVQFGRGTPAEPVPGSQAEAIRDFFCAVQSS